MQIKRDYCLIISIPCKENLDGSQTWIHIRITGKFKDVQKPGFQPQRCRFNWFVMCSGQQEIWETPGDSKVEVNLRITSLENSNKSELLSCSIFDSEDPILILDIRIIIIILHWIIVPTFSSLCSQEHNCKQCHYSSLTAPDSFHWPALPAEPISLRPNPFFNWRPEVTEFSLYIHPANERAGPQEGEAKKKIILHKWKIAENIK